VRQLLWGDVHGERAHFAALYEWLAAEVIFAADQAPLNALPPQARVKLLAVVAAFTPYYTPPEVRRSGTCIPCRSAMRDPQCPHHVIKAVT